MTTPWWLLKQVSTEILFDPPQLYVFGVIASVTTLEASTTVPRVPTSTTVAGSSPTPTDLGGTDEVSFIAVIAGGVAGGLAVAALALVLFAISLLCLVMRKRSKGTNSENQVDEAKDDRLLDLTNPVYGGKLSKKCF